MKRDSTFLSVAILGFILAFAGTVWANGEEFFAAAGSGKIDLVYFGRIKDKRTGHSVTDEAIFLIKDKGTGLSFPFTNDKPGHYRSPGHRDGDQGDRRKGRRQHVRGRAARGRLQEGDDHQSPAQDARQCRARFRAGATRPGRGEHRWSEHDRWRVLHPDRDRPARDRAVLHRKEGANIRPPVVHRRLSPRGSLIGLRAPTLRSNASP